MKNFVEILKKFLHHCGQDLRTKNGVSFLLIVIFFGVVALAFLSKHVLATASTNIESGYGYAWSENGGWINFTAPMGGVMVSDESLSGYAWSENMGWISLNCSDSSVCTTADYRVANDGEGTLSGYSWGENVGWINWRPTGGGVSIDSSGEFSGYAWGENVGWISFNCQDKDTCGTSDFRLKTTWSPATDEGDDSAVNVHSVKYSSSAEAITIEWKTNRNSNSIVFWGADKNLKNEKREKNNVKSHKVTLRNLESNTLYYFRIKSESGDIDDSSRVYSLTTKAASGLFSGHSSDIGSARENAYERVDIDISDQRNTSSEASDSVKEKTGNDISIAVPDRPTVFSKLLTFFRSSGGKISDWFVGMFHGTRNFAFNMYDSVLRGQRWLFASVHSLNADGARRFFTTAVSDDSGVKRLAEVRFQILDREDRPLSGLETTLFSDPQSTVSDENGEVAFRDIPLGHHTLAFEYEGESFRKSVSIADTLTDNGTVRMEIVQVKAEKERIAIWMWGIILLCFASISGGTYFAWKYFTLKKSTRV